jgi:hypothetical protein
MMRSCAFIFISLLVAGCAGDSDWEMVSRQDIPSPDGLHVATVFEMTGHNTTGYEPQVSLRRPNGKLGGRGNVLAGGPGDVFKVQWLSASNLLVAYHVEGSWTSYPSNTDVDGVAVIFKKE